MNIVITAGGTSEKIDNVRKITNSSSGKLGNIIAKTFLNNSFKLDNIFYICTKQSLKPYNKKIKIVLVESVNDLKNAVIDILTNNNIDLFIHTMAVSDYTVDYVTTTDLLYKNFSNQSLNNAELFKELIDNNPFILSNDKKISSSEDNLIIKLKPTPKIISIIKTISPKTNLIGFKLLNDVKNEELIDAGYNLLLKNNCALVIANDLKNINENKHKAFFIDKNKQLLEVNTKIEIANTLFKFIKENKL